MPPQRAPLNYRIRLIVFVLVIAAAIGLVGGIARTVSPGVTEGSAGITGTIYISAVGADTIFPEARTVDVASGQIAAIASDPEGLANMHAFSTDGAYAVFLGARRSDLYGAGDRGDFGHIVQVYMMPYRDGVPLPAPDIIQPLTRDASLGKFTPAVSDSGDVLYVTSAARPSAAHDVSGFTIHIIAAGTTTDTTLFAGVDPVWYSAHAFIYIAPDGIRLYDKASGSSTLLLAVSGQDNFKIAVSPQAQLLAFSNPDARSVALFSLASGAPISLVHEFSLFGFWPVFSPDGRVLAIQTARDTHDALAHPALSFFDTSTFAPARADISLDPYLNSRLFVTAWR